MTLPTENLQSVRQQCLFEKIDKISYLTKLYPFTHEHPRSDLKPLTEKTWGNLRGYDVVLNLFGDRGDDRDKSSNEVESN